MFLKCENNIIGKTGSKFCLNIIIKGVLGGGRDSAQFTYGGSDEEVAATSIHFQDDHHRK